MIWWKAKTTDELKIELAGLEAKNALLTELHTTATALPGNLLNGFLYAKEKAARIKKELELREEEIKLKEEKSHKTVP